MRLIRNRFLQIGIGVLAFLAVGAYWIVDDLLMPRIARHDQLASVPTVVGMPKDVALDVLESSGLALGDTSGRFVGTLDVGDVVSQYPPAGAVVKPGRRVSLVLKRGTPPTVPVPDIAGESQRNALSLLQSAGLVVLMEPDSLPSPLEGPATRTVPPAGTIVPKGDTIRAFYGTGPNYSIMVDVPDLVGLRLNAAIEQLLGLRLSWTVLNQPLDDGNPRITDQSPASGAIRPGRSRSHALCWRAGGVLSRRILNQIHGQICGCIHVDALGILGLQSQSDVVRLQRKLAMTAVD